VKIVLLVDADIVAFKFAAKGQRKTPFGMAIDDLSSVTAGMEAYLQEQMADVGADLCIICLSCPSAECWRKDVLPSYKENRADVDRPVHLAAAKDHLANAYPSYRKDTLEADDVMGILSTMDGLPRNFVAEHPEFAGQLRKIIFSEDKDMKTIPGWLYNPAKDSTPWWVTTEVAAWWHLYQTICGDTTDGYKGCPKAGPVAAEKTLNEGRLQCVQGTGTLGGAEAFMWFQVVALFASKNLTEADALVQARVARICHASDFNFQTQKVILWTPPSNPSTPATAPSASTVPSPKKESRAGTPKDRTTSGK
jgi:hypothetical protein